MGETAILAAKSPGATEQSQAPRVAIVTGGGKGIGLAIAAELAKSGANIAVAGRNQTALSQAVSELTALGAQAIATPLDVTDDDSVARAVQAVFEHFGRIDILVNNAGIAGSSKFLDSSIDEWKKIYDVNVLGVVRVTQAVLPIMLKRNFGRVIQVASVAGRVGFAYASHYAASKHALLGLTRSLALEVATRGVTVNAVCPAWVETDMAAQAVSNIDSRTSVGPERAKELLAQMSPQKRLFSADEVARVVAFLASDGANGIHGQAWNIDGGMVMS